MGTAYLAASGEGDAAGLCVIKLGLPDLPQDLAARFADEAKVMRKLSFGNIAQVFDAGQMEGVRFLAMEYVEGWNLEEALTFAEAAKIAVPVPVAVFIAKEIARGLHYAHTFGDLRIIHRDVAPANVMLGVSGEVKLIDFGVARSNVRRAETAPGLLLGHVEYFAPERFGSDYDHRADLYSAGVVLWEMLTGQALFASRHDGAGAIASPRHGPNPALPSSLRPDVDRDLDEIVSRALALDPEKRFQSGEEMRIALVEYLRDRAPATDCPIVASFLRDAVGEQVIYVQRAERERLLSAAAKVRARTLPRGVQEPVGPLGEEAPVATSPALQPMPQGHRRGLVMVGAAAGLTVFLVASVKLLRHFQMATPGPAPPLVVTPAEVHVDVSAIDRGRADPLAVKAPTSEAVASGDEHALVTSDVAKSPSRGSDRPTKPTRFEAARPGQGRHAAAAALARAAAAALDVGNYVDAVDLGEEAIGAGSADARTRVTVGTGNLMLGRVKEARRHFEAALRLDPGNVQAAEGLAAADRAGR